MTKIHLAAGLSLPVDAATQTILDIGKRGSGKSTTAARIVEQFAKAKVPFVVLDPADTWWGLKASRDGGPGLNVYVFGGRHADLPLEPGGGALVAELLCEHRIPLVLSCKHLSGAARSRFMADFATTLFQKWAGGPLHVVMEEAHELAPQAPPKGEQAEVMLGAFKRLWKLGRSSGIGGTAITQRPAALHKDITTQSEILIVHRTIGPQDVAAVREWIKYHGESDAILSELATLKTGEAFVWGPEFPEGNPIGLVRVQMLGRETFDSSATPKVGAARVEPKELAPVDLERFGAKMAATVERVKATDPRELQKALAESKATNARLERQLAQAAKQPNPTAATERQPKTVEKLILKDAQVARLEKLAESLAKIGDTLAQRQQVVVSEIGNLHTMSNEIIAALRAAASTESPRPRAIAGGGGPGAADKSSARSSRPAPVVPRPAREGDSLPEGERKILIAAAQTPNGVTREQASILSGYKRSTRDRYIQYLTAKGLVAFNGDAMLATDAGLAALGSDFEELPTGAALLDYWLQRLPTGEQKILAALSRAHPEAVERDALEEETGFKRSTRDRYIQYLQTRKLVVAVGRGAVRASDELFS